MRKERKSRARANQVGSVDRQILLPEMFSFLDRGQSRSATLDLLELASQ